MSDLTLKQERVLSFIRKRIRQNIPPTIREIARDMGFSSTGTVRDYLAALEKKGYLKRSQNLSRAIELLKEKTAGIPIIGAIPAGSPNLAYEDVLGYIEPGDIFGGRAMRDDIFALKVKGDSMIETGIMDGDIAVIHRQSVAGNGEIVAALLEDNEVTLKRLRHKNAGAFLEPANKNYQPIHKEFTIIGKLITILRKY